LYTAIRIFPPLLPPRRLQQSNNGWKQSHAELNISNLNTLHFTTLLELALWKAKLDESQDERPLGNAKKAKIDVKAARQEQRITSGANIVIKNVLPFLKLE